MPISGKLEKAAKERGITVKQLCDWAVEAFGSEFLAAVKLDVYPNAIRHHRKKSSTSRNTTKEQP